MMIIIITADSSESERYRPPSELAWPGMRGALGFGARGARARGA